jgi:hypothetical protein
MNPLLQTVAELLKSKQFRFSITDDGRELCFGCTGENLVWSTLVNTDEEASLVTFLSRLPVRIPPAARAACASLLARLNYGRRCGAFHMDLNDGDVLFCISHIVAGQEITAAVMDGLMGMTYGAMDGGATEVLKLVYGGSQLAESKSSDSSRLPRNQRLELN